MNTHKISDSVYYIGVNDRTTDRFESLWPLPEGVSYNSYLVKGSDKSAIIDGVDERHALQQIDSIKDLLGERHPDYLIINHMEPDHSGAIRILRQAFPDLKIVGNAQTLNMVKGFYGVDDNTLAVKDGDTIELGDGEELRFYLTPMVHWPETMMTYLVPEKTLFSGDAFGCFGALDGAVVDTDMDTSRYMPEMVRYYSNIVGKYGQFVQKALKKLEAIEIETICPTHGPVWRSRRADVIELYDRLSRYEPLDDGVTIVYGSMYGNTERMAESVAEGLAEAGVRNIVMRNAAKTDLSYILSDIFTHAGIVIAAPTYSDTLFPPVEAVMRAMAVRSVSNRKMALLSSYTWAPQAMKRMNALIDGTSLAPTVAPVMAKQAPDANILATCRSVAAELAEQIKTRM